MAGLAFLLNVGRLNEKIYYMQFRDSSAAVKDIKRIRFAGFVWVIVGLLLLFWNR